MPIELHAFDTPNGRKISVALEEMALPYTVKIVDIRKGSSSNPNSLRSPRTARSRRSSTRTGPTESRSACSNRARSSSTSARRPASSGRATWRRAFRFSNGSCSRWEISDRSRDRSTISCPRKRGRPSLRTRALFEGDAAAVRGHGPQTRHARVLRGRTVDRRLLHSGVGVAAPAAQGRSRRVSARPAVVRHDDGASRRPAWVRGETELIR